MMHRCALVTAVGLASVLLVGCHRGNVYGCEDTQRYAAAASAAPIQIPDDLSPPSEVDALRLPPVVTDSHAQSEHCLEDPPAFSAQIRLGRHAEGQAEGSGAQAEPDASTPPAPNPKEGRRQRRHADGR